MHTFKVPSLTLHVVLTVSLVVFALTMYSYIVDRQTVVVFCDVGQGDGVYMRINNRVDVLIDAGPDSRILNCLGKHMPFFDKTIELAFLTHPHLDHYGGFDEIIKHYKIERFFGGGYRSDSAYYNRLFDNLTKNKISITPVYQGDKIYVLDSYFSVYWPIKSFAEAAKPSDDHNALSQVCLFSQRNVSILFTGDINPDIGNRLLQQPINKVSILKVPHHGSTMGLIHDFLILADPTYAVISSGNANKYNHPHAEIIKMLTDFGVKIKRTDTDSDIVFRF